MRKPMSPETIARRKLKRALERVAQIELLVRKTFLPISRGGNPKTATASVELPTGALYGVTAMYYCSSPDGPKLLRQLNRATLIVNDRSAQVEPFRQRRSAQRMRLLEARAKAEADLETERATRLNDILTGMGVATCSHPQPNELLYCEFCKRHLCKSCSSVLRCAECGCEDLCIDCRVIERDSGSATTLCPRCAEQIGGERELISLKDARTLLPKRTSVDVDLEPDHLLSKSAWQRRLGACNVKDGEKPVCVRFDGVQLWRRDQMEMYESQEGSERKRLEAIKVLESLLQ